jgi:membrane protein YdbS with pleckstrin-like domain
VAYSELILRDDETLVLDLHPHWWYFAKALLATVVAVVIGMVVLVEGWTGTAVNVVVALLVLGALFWLGERYVHWVTTYFILTTDRIIYRRGIVAKKGMEIPLQRINTIFFNQRIFERILGLGDLKIESASKSAAPTRCSTRSTRRWRPSRAGGTTGSATVSPRRRPRHRLPPPHRPPPRHPRPRPRPSCPRRPSGSPSCTSSTPRARLPTPSSKPRRPSCSSRCRSTMRIVSLVPSVTETLLAWGIEPVAVTRFCEQPALPAVGGTKDPDLVAIATLAPDLVVMCDEENRRADAEALAAAGLALHVVRIDSLSDVGPQMAQLAEAVGAPAPPRWAPPEVRTAARRSAFLPIWRRPWMTSSAGCYGSSMLAALGIDNVFADSTDRYPTVTLDEAEARHPELVVAPSEPYPFGERHRRELERVAPVVLVDGQDLFWWGHRTPAAFERLAEQLVS